jgi:AsmA protein
MQDTGQEAVSARTELEQEAAVRPETDKPVHSGVPLPFGGYADELAAEDLGPQPLKFGSRRRAVWTLAVMVMFGLAALLPPLVNVNRYQRRIVTSIGESLGRPVHLDSVTLNVLPLPGFTLTNFEVSDDPAFGSEPVIHANSVRATLRLRSLWHRRLEFSRILLDDASVNLVRRADGRWNVESILLQASRIPVVPTEQTIAGPAPRFPYIEATGARVNVKQGLEKEPISLTDTEFALWLAKPEMWRVRLEGHPARTDTAATDTGVVRLEGTLGKAAKLEGVPIDLHAEWNAVPLGAASWVLTGQDQGLRGEMTLSGSAEGTVGENTATARLELRGIRRADFVPARALDVDVSCKATAAAVFHRLEEIKCLWPPDAEQSGLGSLILSGWVPDIHHWQTADLVAHWDDVATQNLVEVLRVSNAHVSKDLVAGGTLAGEWSCCGDGAGLGSVSSFSWDHPRLALGKTQLHPEDDQLPGESIGDKLTLAPIDLNLGGPQPAELTIQADRTGLRMHLAGTLLRSRLLALGGALPQFGQGLAAALPEASASLETKSPEVPIKVDLTALHPWGGAQTWSAAVAAKKARRR